MSKRNNWQANICKLFYNAVKKIYPSYSPPMIELYNMAAPILLLLDLKGKFFNELHPFVKIIKVKL